MSDEYLEAFQNFFHERFRSQTKKNNDKCEGCNSIKQFIIKKDKLIYSCGSKSGKCGKQFEITLPKYIYFPEMKYEIYKQNDQFDYNTKLDGLYTEEEIEQKKILNKQKKDLLKYNQKLFKKINHHDKRGKSIQKLHKDRLNDKKELILLCQKIKDESNLDKKIKLQKEYIGLNLKMNTEYKQMLELNNVVNNFIPIEPGSLH